MPKQGNKRVDAAGSGTQQDRMGGTGQVPIKLDATLPKRDLPAHIKEKLKAITKRKESP